MDHGAMQFIQEMNKPVNDNERQEDILSIIERFINFIEDLQT